MKKAIAILLTMAMSAALLVGCGSSESSTPAASAPAEEAPAEEAAPAEDATEAAAEPAGTAFVESDDPADWPTLTFFDKNSGSKLFDDPVALELMNRLHINIEVINPSGDPAEKLALMLAGQDYPDFVLMDRSSDIVNKYIEAGALVNLTEYMDKLPNVVAMYGDTISKSVYSDGNTYWLNNWYGFDPDPVYAVNMRYDILCELVGKERADSAEAFTVSEFMDLCEQFLEKYPEIDGYETIAVTMGEGGNEDYCKGMYGIKTYYNDNGTLKWDVRDPKYIDAMGFVNDLYTAGYLDKEWVSNKDEVRNQKMAAGYVFAEFGSYWDVWNPNAALSSAKGEDAVYLAYKVMPDGADPEVNTLSPRSSLGWDAIGLTTNCENIDAALHFIDYCASQEGQDLLLWGIEGEHWTMDGDNYVPNEEIMLGLQNDNSNTVTATGITRWTWFVRNSSTHKDGSPCRMQFAVQDRVNQQAYKTLTNGYYDTAIYNNLIPTGNSTDALKAQKVQDIFDQAYPKMVNAASREEMVMVYDEMIADMEAAGLADVEAVIDAGYQERVALWGVTE